MNRKYLIVYLGIVLASGMAVELVAQPGHGSTAAHEAMDHEQTATQEQPALRDPHAYSGGFRRASGPYSLSSQQHPKMADEAVFSGLWMERFEYANFDGNDATVLEGHGWLGNSYRRLLLKVEAELVDDSVAEGEIDLLWSNAISPFWNLQAGATREIGEISNRNWLTLGFKGLAPYWLEIDTNIFIGESGRTALDFEAEYELLLTQRLVLQPRIDVSAFGDTDRTMGRGKGLAELKTGVRLRYEFSRQFAPYLGIERTSTFGETADLLPAGTNRHETNWVLGIRFWF